MSTTDWRIFDSLLYPNQPYWRPGDEPAIVNKVTIRYKGRVTTVVLPEGAEVVELEELRETARDSIYSLQESLDCAGIPASPKPVCKHERTFKVRFHDESGGGHGTMCEDCGWCDAVEAGLVCGECLQWSRVGD